MDKNQIQFYKTQLEEQRRKIMVEIKTDEKADDFGDDIDHFDEETDEAEETGAKLSIVEALKIQLNEIDTALNDIVSGKYGICKLCGKEIEPKVLNVVPESQFCSTCKKRQNDISRV